MGVRGSCFREMLNKDNLENEPQHSAASVPPPAPPTPPPHTLLFPAHTQLPKAALIRPVFVLLSETGSGGRRTEAEVTTDLRANVSEGQSALSLDGWWRPGANNKKIIKFMVLQQVSNKSADVSLSLKIN